MKLNIKKKNIFYPYIIFGIILFIILFLINFFYNKKILNLTFGNQYKISATQLDDFKYQSYSDIMATIFSNKIKTVHRIRDVSVDKPGLTLKSTKSSLNFTLILKKYVDEKELENVINETYQGQLKETLNMLEVNNYLFDFISLEKSYEKYRESEINKSYENLVNSDFAKKYPVIRCDGSEEYCLKEYYNYYLFVFKQLKLDNLDNVKRFLNVENNENLSIREIYEDFTVYKNLYNNKNVLISLSDNDKSNHRNNFFNDHYKQILDSQFYADYNNILSEMRCSENNITGCLRQMSGIFNDLIYQHKDEIRNPYKVKYLKPKERQKFNWIPEILKILGFTLLVVYILFIFTNKFLRRKLK